MTTLRKSLNTEISRRKYRDSVERSFSRLSQWSYRQRALCRRTMQKPLSGLSPREKRILHNTQATARPVRKYVVDMETTITEKEFCRHYGKICIRNLAAHPPFYLFIQFVAKIINFKWLTRNKVTPLWVLVCFFDFFFKSVNTWMKFLTVLNQLHRQTGITIHLGVKFALCFYWLCISINLELTSRITCRET